MHAQQSAAKGRVVPSEVTRLSHGLQKQWRTKMKVKGTTLLGICNYTKPCLPALFMPNRGGCIVFRYPYRLEISHFPCKPGTYWQPRIAYFTMYYLLHANTHTSYTSRLHCLPKRKCVTLLPGTPKWLEKRHYPCTMYNMLSHHCQTIHIVFSM